MAEPEPLQSVCPACQQPLPAARRDPLTLVASLSLTPRERNLAELLARNFGQWLPTERLVGHHYAGDPDAVPLSAANAVSVRVRSLRTKLRRVGLAIQGTKGSGACRRMVWLERARATDA